MSKILVGLGIVTLFLLAVFLVLNQNKVDETPTINKSPTYQNISSLKLKEILENERDSIYLLDVRTQAEYDVGRIDTPNALVPHTDIEKRVSELPSKDTTIVVYCRSGSRSSIAAGTLLNLGYENVLNLEKGIIDWEKAGYPITK